MTTMQDRMIFWLSAFLTGFVTIVVASSASAVLKTTYRGDREAQVVSIDGWCNPGSCTQVGKALDGLPSPRLN